jgi:hypothetical protein
LKNDVKATDESMGSTRATGSAVEIRDRGLLNPLVVDHHELFVRALLGDVRDLRLRDAPLPGELVDHLVGDPVREAPVVGEGSTQNIFEAIRRNSGFVRS